jgi:hypothetical protein
MCSERSVYMRRERRRHDITNDLGRNLGFDDHGNHAGLQVSSLCPALSTRVPFSSVFASASCSALPASLFHVDFCDKRGWLDSASDLARRYPLILRLQHDQQRVLKYAHLFHQYLFVWIDTVILSPLYLCHRNRSAFIFGIGFITFISWFRDTEVSVMTRLYHRFELLPPLVPLS